MTTPIDAVAKGKNKQEMLSRDENLSKFLVIIDLNWHLFGGLALLKPMMN